MSQPLPATYAFEFNRGQLVVPVLMFAAGLIYATTTEWVGRYASVQEFVAVGCGAMVLAGVAALVLTKGVQLDPDGFDVSYVVGKRRYRWAEVSAFTCEQTIITMLAFDLVAPKGGAEQAASAFLSGKHMSIHGAQFGADVKFACAVMNAFRARALGIPA